MLSIFSFLYLCPVLAKPEPLNVHSAESGKLYTQEGKIHCPKPIPATTSRPKSTSIKAVQGWALHNKGVGDLWVTNRVPESINQLEGQPYDADYNRITSNMNPMERMEKGYMDQAGFELIALRHLDVIIRRAIDNRVFGLYPGFNVRTKEGTGKGSSLQELLNAHGSIMLHRVPEPYLCSVTVPQMEKVYFMFSDCEQACQGERALNVYVDTDDRDSFE